MSRISSITSNIYDEKQDNKTICEAFRCIDKATEKIKVNAGKYGMIELALCKKCKAFFDNPIKNQINQSFQGSNQQASFVNGYDRH